MSIDELMSELQLLAAEKLGEGARVAFAESDFKKTLGPIAAERMRASGMATVTRTLHVYMPNGEIRMTTFVEERDWPHKVKGDRGAIDEMIKVLHTIEIADAAQRAEPKAERGEQGGQA